MILSIRRFLLINLLVSITLTTTLTAIGNYILDQKDIQNHLDSLLSQSALAFQALIGDDISERNLLKMQIELNTMPRLAKQYYKSLSYNLQYGYEEKFQFQVWDKDKLLIHSANAPLDPLSDGKEGFNNIKINGEPWRIFTAIDQRTGITTVVAERYDIRAELGHRITRDDVFIMLLVYPLLGVMIWLIIGRGLKPLNRIAFEVSNRAPSYLEPVDLSSVPVEIKALVDELNKLLFRLKNAFDREKRFAADAAHELRTPLAALKTQAQLILKLNDEKERETALYKLIRSVDRSTHIVQQLLTLSRIVPDGPETMTNITRVNLYKVAVEEIAEAVPNALKKNIDIELHCPNEKLTVKGNATALGILLRNLVDNAIRYIPENSHIWVNISEDEKHVILRVTDDGPGIAPELRTRVFERFYRILGTKQTGSGLGLAIVQQISTLHQAEVVLGTPESGKGLEISVYFPKASSLGMKSEKEG